MTTPRAVRSDLVWGTLSPARAAAAQYAVSELTLFRQQFDLPLTPHTVMLHLTALLDSGQMTGRGLRSRLHVLDLAARIEGLPPWSAHPDIRRVLHGLHRERPITGSPRANPLYWELVQAVVDATMTPTHEQVRDTAILLTAHETRLPVQALAALRWADLKFTPHGVDITVPDFPRRGPRPIARVVIALRGDPTCAAAALRRLRRQTGSIQGPVFGSRWGACDRGTVSAVTRLLRPGTDPPRAPGPPDPAIHRLLNQVSAPSPAQLRDRALILIGYGAALRGRETIALRQSQITSGERGLVLYPAGRSSPVAIPALGNEYCARSAWGTWSSELDRVGLHIPDAAAFMQISGTIIWQASMMPMGLNYLIHQRCGQAHLTGTYTFTSLRTGYIRTALRGGEAAHRLAAHADLSSLSSVARHEHRENLLRRNIAGQLGL